MGQEQHVVDEAPHPLPLGVYGGQESFRFFGGGFFCAVLSADGAGTGEDDRQRGAQFMGGGGDEFRLFSAVLYQRQDHAPGKEPEKHSQKKYAEDVCAGK